jgi:hypothetical protein
MDDMELINNIKYTYVYRSPVGIFYIRFNSSLQKWDLGMENEVFGNYATTIAAADDVYCQSTSCNQWDMFDITKIDAPTDIYEWERIPNNQLGR